MVQATQVTQATRLAELAADVLTFAVHLRGAPEPDAESLRAEVRRLVSAFDACHPFNIFRGFYRSTLCYR